MRRLPGTTPHPTSPDHRQDVARPRALGRRAAPSRTWRPAVGLALAALLLPGLASPATAAATVGPSATPAATPATAPTALSPRASDAAGAATIGTARYAYPADAVFVSPRGSDSASGRVAAPVRTVARALALVRSGGVVVLRTGIYHESVTVQGKPVTLQSYPGEPVWFDGAQAVSGWVRDGSAWRRDGWTQRFDHSPTYTKGAPDNTASGWAFVDRAHHPMAAHPDQVWVAGARQTQVASRAAVRPGTFYLDESTSRLYLGTDPTRRTVLVSTLAKALTIRSAGTVVRGIAFVRYAPSVWHVGAITVEAPRARLENVLVSDMSTTGLSVIATDVVVSRVTVQISGMLGLHARYADRLTLDRVRSVRNNVEHFNAAPVSGGAKLGSTRGVRVTDSAFTDNYGPGFWEDCSVYDTVLRRSSFSRNSHDGIFLELSAKAVVGDNVVVDNGRDGIKVNNTSDVQIWNNTLRGNARPLNLVQDPRRNTDPRDQAVDRRQPFPDRTMPWTLGPVRVSDNVIGPPRTGNCLLCVEDYSFSRTAEQMGIRAEGNVYARATTRQPVWLVVWSRGSVNVNPYVFTSLTGFRGTTRQETSGREYVGRSIFAGAGLDLAADVRAAQAAVAVPLPTAVAALIGRPAASERLGIW